MKPSTVGTSRLRWVHASVAVLIHRRDRGAEPGPGGPRPETGGPEIGAWADPAPGTWVWVNSEPTDGQIHLVL